MTQRIPPNPQSVHNHLVPLGDCSGIRYHFKGFVDVAVLGDAPGLMINELSAVLTGVFGIFSH